MFQLTLLTPQKKLLVDESVEEVFIPGYEGEMHILPGHAPLMSMMGTGVMKYRKAGEGKLTPIAISWGYAEVSPSGMNVLAETAETAEEIDLGRAKAAEKKAETELANLDLDQEMIEKYLHKLERARVRQEVAQ